MQQYIVRRILLMIPTLLIVSMAIFSLVRLMPGDVVATQLASSPNFKKEDIAALRHQLGIDRSWPSQYVRWVGGILKGDFGRSLWSHRTATSAIGDALPITLELAILAFVIANVFAVLFGILSATHQDSPLDYVIRLVSIGGLSIPNFWLGTLIVVLGSKYLHYLPPLTYTPLTKSVSKNLAQFIIPSSVIAVSVSATIMRLTRSSMLEVLRQDYVRTALAKGLRERAVIYRHCVRNAILPVVTVQGFQLGTLLTGSVIIEVIFGLPGLGRLSFDSVNVRDYTLIQAATFMFAIMFMAINLLVDLSYVWIDPRIKY